MSSDRKLIVVTATREMPVDVDTLAKALGPGFDLEVVPLPFGDMSLSARENYWRLIARAHGLFVRTGNIPYELIGHCHQLKVISLHGIGVDQVDVKAATEAGIYVTNVPGGNAQSVAELTVGIMLALFRQIPRADLLVRQGQWEAARTVGRELCGKRMGLVGYGSIAERVARLAHAFGMEVAFYSRSQKESAWARQLPLEELFGTSHVVSLHIPLNHETRGMINRRLLSLLRKDAVLINTARGGVVVQEDLLQALQEGWFAGAALDVFEHEPLSPGSPFLTLPNVVLTPHMGGSSRECLTRLSTAAGEDLRLVLTGGRPRYGVNQPWLL